MLAGLGTVQGGSVCGESPPAISVAVSQLLPLLSYQDDLLDLPVSILLSDGERRHPLPGCVEVQELAGQECGHTEPVT